MKNLPIYFFILVFFSFSSAVIAQDDVYYDPSDDQLAPAEAYEAVDDADYSDYIAYDGVEENTKVDFSSDNSYTYASRIRRFNRPYQGFNYYDPCYTDAYYYGSTNTGSSIYVVNTVNSVTNYNPYAGYVYGNYNPYAGYVYGNNNPYNSYVSNSYGYTNSGYGSAYDPCNVYGGYGTASPYTAGGGWNTINSTPTTTTIRPNQGNNVPGTPTTTVPSIPRGGNGQTAVPTTGPKPSIGKTTTTRSKPSISKTKPQRFTKPSTGATKYTKPTRTTTTKPNRTSRPSYNKPSRSSAPSYNRPSRSTPSYSAPSRSGGNSGGSKSSPSRGGMRGGK